MQRSEALEEFGLDPSFNENLRDFINISFQAGAGRGDSLLDVCSLAHFPRCPPVPSYSEQFLPTRLIDLENPECPRLVLAAEIRELMRISSVWTDHRYACLSHQWGRASMPTIATLTSNINSRLVGFKLDELPQRYREAMALCFVLKIRYMWIDFVCIVQDSIRDWKSESSMMGQVYEQGILTICIDKSIDDQQWRPPAPSEWILKPGETDRDDSWLSEMLCNGPLAHRAWCLQERYLSPRIIHMLENCWIWECNSVLRTSALRSEIIPIGKSWRKLSPNQGSPAFRRKSALFSWEDIIIDYSKRQLTYDSDKLPAISGIADKLQRDIGGRYLAGIWETDLCGLLWYCGNKPIRCKLDSIPPPKSQIPVRSPKTYRAPTWSWASLDEPVSYKQAHE
ncbi:HET-domain-containing protein [Stipitochalara longipes BDJ]|nr:HET-domain-containing protein [Stipitochalara longipes BDJ]